MKKRLFLCLLYATVTGAVSGCAVFLFRFTADFVSKLSSSAFDLAGKNPLLIPILIISGALLGTLASVILKWEPEASGGGIPSAVAAVRGIITLRPIRNFIATFVSATLTYGAGIPLGTEGPSVILGTNVGCVTASLAGKFASPTKRYSMTGGAVAGFAAATGAPVCSILFALEEAHKKITPTLFITSAVSVVCSLSIHSLLCRLSGLSDSLFHVTSTVKLTLTQLFIPLVIGVFCGVAAVIFTCIHTHFGKLMTKKLSSFPSAVKFSAVFALCVAVGCFNSSFTGSGHHLTEHLLSDTSPLISLAVIFLVRWVLLIITNNMGVTGGTFIPNLTFGAILGSICALIMEKSGIMSSELISLSVALGMCAYLGAVSKTPIMAILFGVEVLGGVVNIPAFVIASLTSYLIMEIGGIKEFVDVAIEKKIEKLEHSGKKQAYSIDVTVSKDSFAYGAVTSDLLLPYGCSIHSEGTHIGDNVKVTCEVIDKKATEVELSALFGSEIKLNNITKQEIHHGTEKQSYI